MDPSLHSAELAIVQKALAKAAASANAAVEPSHDGLIRPKAHLADPAFALRPCDLRVRLGETAKFCCRVIGSLPLAVFWYKLNGERELANDEKYEIGSEVTTSDENPLHWLKVYSTSDTDAGTYLCVISNEREQNVDSFCLQVRGNLQRVSFMIHLRVKIEKHLNIFLNVI